VVDDAGGGDLAAQGKRMAVTLDGALPFRLHRCLALLREGGRKHLVGGRIVPLAMMSVRNIASSLGYIFAFSTRDFAGKTPYVAGCGDRDEPYKALPLADRTPAQVANGETHCGCPLKSQVVAGWLQGSKKQATRLGEASAQTPLVTADNMAVACDLATDGVDIDDFDEPLTALQYERLTVYVIMVFSFCTMLRPENLLKLTARDVFFPPDFGENAAFLQEHGCPRWVKVRYSQLKTNVAGTAPAPAYYFWSSDATDEETCASPENDSASVCVRCPELWCDLPYFVYLFVQLRAEDPCFDMTASVPFFVVPVAGNPGGVGAMGNIPVTKAWWQQRLSSFVLVFDPLLSARGVGGLYGFRRGATQFWLSYTGNVEMVMRMGVWKPNSTRFPFYVLNYRCRGTFRARIVDYYRADRQDLVERLEEMVSGFREWFETREFDLYEERQGNFFARGFAV